MRIRTIALAIPLAGLAACSTGSTQGSRTASTDRQGAAVSGGAQANAGGAGASTGANANTGTAPPSSQGSLSAPGATADATGSGGAAHAGDQLVTGKITHVTPQAVTIAAEDGDHTLNLAPETTILVDGQTADRTALSEGLPARASFSTVGGQDVAVRIYAVRNTGPAIDPGAGGTGGMHGGDSGDSSVKHGTRPPTRQ